MAVLAGRNMTVSDGQVSVHENTSVNLTCDVDAMPSPGTTALNWYRNDRLVHRGQYFVLSNVEQSDAGQYECQTSNIMTPSSGSNQTGVGRAVINVIVMCKHA